MNTGFGSAAASRHEVAVYDYGGDELVGARELRSDSRGEVCVTALPSGDERDSYTMVAFVTKRGDVEHAPVIAHLARDPDGSLRIIGIERR